MRKLAENIESEKDFLVEKRLPKERLWEDGIPIAGIDNVKQRGLTKIFSD